MASKNVSTLVPKCMGDKGHLASSNASFGEITYSKFSLKLRVKQRLSRQCTKSLKHFHKGVLRF